MQDFKNDVGIVHLLDPQDLAHTNTASLILDTAKCDGALLAVSVGPLTGVDGSNYVTPKVQESNTIVGTDFADVAAGDLIGAFTKIDSTSEDSVTQYVGYRGMKRYVRVYLTYTGTGITAGVIGILGILGFPGKGPISVPAAISAT